uniref:Methyltransferase, putative n=1 Tax=Chlorobium chlorochromatii (strain CaD3) TaxID=340177 RepID=Q3AS75_CHLCH
MMSSSYSLEKFNREAATWDEKPRRRLVAKAVAHAIIAHAKPQPTMRALEFGCGSGLVTMPIAPLVGSLVAVDTSPEMVKMVQQKAEEAALTTLTTLVDDLFAEAEAYREPFDLIFSSMTLHHIADTATVLQRVAQLLVTGGVLALADLELEDGFFHDDPHEEVHPGFERSALEAALSAAGLQVRSYHIAHTIHKCNRAGVDAAYPIFLLVAEKV